ncbi:MAG TPA: hypothetical protein PK325_01260 [Cyclobacteriaceae bacterium]|nr:hypothetical protein [Cyclobacteriaceae bacterium]HMV08102.1 hypothetical protein [Cyclobacteriaceae bacterium]HMV88316.1 hypothetical protein [Cyclobacteriaceae bacterium]HMX00743.1 hypothetical protein [Cyclobacteriaceae bacterium]HMX49382.1 hypothetical protein [Cyclobacteriaceae bacterium]
MKTMRILIGLMLATMLPNCSDEVAVERVWRIKSVVGTGDRGSTINLNYNKQGVITSVDQVTDGISVTFYPSLLDKNITLSYESTNGAAERVFTFNADSTLASIYDATATDVNRKFFYEEYVGYNRMAGFYRESNGDTTSLRKFLWSGNEIPNLKSYGYTDGVRDQEYELINMISDEVLNPTYAQFPVELSAVLFDQEEFLMYGLANPAKFQTYAERTIYSDLQFDSFGHWTGYTRRVIGSSSQDVIIVWENAAISH